MSEQPPGDRPSPSEHPSAPPQPDPGQPPQPWQPGPPVSAGQPYPGQPYPGQPYPAQQAYPGQPYPGQPYPGQPFPGVFRPPPAIPALPREAYAPWGRRALSSLIDFAPTVVGLIVYLVAYVAFMVTTFGQLSSGVGTSPPTFVNPGMIVGWVIMLAAVPWNIYNRWITGGKTGQSLGKRVARLTLLSEETGSPVGAGMAFLRDLVHTLDGIAYVGYLWPLWDEKRQTFADKLMRTVVLPLADAGPTTPPRP